MGFKLEENMPNHYVDKSRDFQLLCRIIDVYLKGCIDRASNINHQLDLNVCNESLLYAIANMQGFTTKMYIPPDILRNILQVFPYCIKNKGNEKSIETMTQAIMASDRLLSEINVYFERDKDNGQYDVVIRVRGSEQYLPYLKEALSFLIPASWSIEIILLEEIASFAKDIFMNSNFSSTFRILPSKIMSGRDNLLHLNPPLKPPTSYINISLTADEYNNSKDNKGVSKTYYIKNNSGGYDKASGDFDASLDYYYVGISNDYISSNGTGVYSRFNTFKILSARGTKNGENNLLSQSFGNNDSKKLIESDGTLNYLVENMVVENITGIKGN